MYIATLSLKGDAPLEKENQIGETVASIVDVRKCSVLFVAGVEQLKRFVQAVPLILSVSLIPSSSPAHLVPAITSVDSWNDRYGYILFP